MPPPFEALLLAIADKNMSAHRHRAAFSRAAAVGNWEEPSDSAFRLNEKEKAEAAVKQLLKSPKRLGIGTIAGGTLAQELAERARDRGGGKDRVLVYCHSRDTAQKVADEIGKGVRAESAKGKGDAPEARVELLVGARRVREREALAESPVYRRFTGDGGSAGDGPAFLVATAAGEVGVDLDADQMVCDLVAFERMVQRLGRVNRHSRPAPAMVDVLVDPTVIKADMQRAEAVRAILEGLPLVPDEDGRRDASPAALARLRENPSQAKVRIRFAELHGKVESRDKAPGGVTRLARASRARAASGAM